MTFGGSYSEVWRDGSGREYQFRMVRPEDKHLFVEGLSECSPATLYNRFLGAKTRFLDQELAYLTDPDLERHVAIVAIFEERLVAVGRAAKYTGIDDEADLGLIVADAHQGRGIGKALLGRLAGAMRERGVMFLRGEMFSANERMYRVAVSSGYPVQRLVVGPVAHIAISIGGGDEG